MHQRLGDLRKLVDETEARRLEDGGRLTAQLELLSAGARSLAVALGSTQSRGRWGEIQLERILEFVGMEEGVDYSCQAAGHGGRPDVVVHLPGGKNVVIDSKAPFDAFERAAQADRRRGARRGARRFRAEGPLPRQELGRKGYWAHVTPSPDFTFMFLPGDAYLAAAEEQDAELFALRIRARSPAGDAAHDRRDAADDPGRVAERERVRARTRQCSRSRRSSTSA